MVGSEGKFAVVDVALGIAGAVALSPTQGVGQVRQFDSLPVDVQILGSELLGVAVDIDARRTRGGPAHLGTETEARCLLRTAT